MNALIATRTRRLSWALLSLVMAFLFVLFLIWLGARNGGPLPARGQLMIRLFVIPPMLAIVVLAFLTSACPSVPADTAKFAAEPPTAAPPRPFRAQVVGLQWLNPLQRLDYSTEWQLLWTLGLVKANKNDNWVRDMPERYSTVQVVAKIARGPFGPKSTGDYHRQYIERLMTVFRDNYFASPDYFYNAHPEHPGRWRELAGIHVEYALPEGMLDPVAAAELTAERITDVFDVVDTDVPGLRSRAKPAEVHVTTGDANAGFASLSAALDYLQAHPAETVWAMSWDAPRLREEAEMNENLVVLFLAGPDYDTAREPLAWIGYPATRRIGDFDVRKGQPSRAVQAWKATVEAAARHADKQSSDIGYVIHDRGNAACTRAASSPSSRIGSFMEALGSELPEFDVMKQSFDTPALLGEMGAGTALTNVALAISYANHLGKNVLVAGTTDADEPTAVMVVPPDAVRPIDPSRDWFHALWSRHIYLPWWGLRHDMPLQSRIQGYSD